MSGLEGIWNFAEKFYKFESPEDVRILAFLWKMIEGKSNSSSSHIGRSSTTGGAGARKSAAVTPSTPTTTLKPGLFTKEQFQRGCQNWGIDSEASLKNLLPSLDVGFLETEDFRNFFKVYFMYTCILCRTSYSSLIQSDLYVSI